MQVTQPMSCRSKLVSCPAAQSLDQWLPACPLGKAHCHFLLLLLFTLCPSPTHVPNFTIQSITAQTSGSSHSDPSFPSPHFNHSLTFHGAPIQLDPVLPPSPATASSWHDQPLLRAQTDKSSSKVHPLCVTDIPSHHGEPRVQ